MSSVACVAFCAFLFDFHPIVYAYSTQPTYIPWQAFKSIFCAVHTELFSFNNKAGVTQAPLPLTFILLANHTQLPWGLGMC